LTQWLAITNPLAGHFHHGFRESNSGHAPCVEVHVKPHGGYYIAWRRRRVSEVTVGSPDQYLQLGTKHR
jgi:hypothetical protein